MTSIQQPKMIPNLLYCEKCEGRGYLVADADWEPYAVQCDDCKDRWPLVTITVNPDDLLICTENHGGYMGGYCFACKVGGWLDKIKHKQGCPLHPEYKR